MSKANPVWRDIVKARPDMTEEEAKEAAACLSTVRSSMLHRCNNVKDKDYPRYGGRGITVCPEWSDNTTGLRDFAVWAVQSGWAPGLTIDRKDNDAGYSPSNCRCASRMAQSYNRASNKSVTLDIPVKVLQRILKVNGYRFKELLAGGKTAIEEKLIDTVSAGYLDRTRDRKTRLYQGRCPCCGEPATEVYRSKAGNHKWVIIGCPSCVKQADTYAAAVEAGVFDM